MLMRWDPFREVDRMLDQAARVTGGTAGGGRLAGLTMDAYRRGDTFLVDFDLPGVDRDSVEITVERNVLRVTAERGRRFREGDDVLINERPAGRVTRELFLGEMLDTGRIEANYSDGVLTLTIPVTEQAKPQRISISGGGDQQTIDVSESNRSQVEAESTS